MPNIPGNKPCTELETRAGISAKDWVDLTISVLSLPQISSEWREKTNRVILASNVGRLQIALVAAHRVIPITSVA